MKRQRGVTFVGMIFIGGLIVFFAIIGLRMIPAYIEYATIKNHLRELSRAPDARGASPRDIQQLFNRRAQIDDITAIRGDDIDIIKEGENISLSVAYSKRIKLMGNVSACIDFIARSD